MAILLNKDFDILKSTLARSLKEILGRDCETPSGETLTRCELHIPYHQIVPDEDTQDRAFAAITYIVHCPREKTHTVRINFQYDRFGKFLRETMAYV